MAVVKWDPVPELAARQERINRLFCESFPRATEVGQPPAACVWRPCVDVWETEGDIVLLADLPGVEKANIAVEVKDDVLTIKGERRPVEGTEQGHYYRRERCCGRFERAFSLQFEVDPDSIGAAFKDGVLRVTIPKPAQENGGRVTIA
jgi:HSP20 family protein